MFAAMFNMPDIVSELLQDGADGKMEDNKGNTAFDWSDKNQKLAGTDALKALQAAAGE